MDADLPSHDPNSNRAGEWCHVALWAMDYFQVLGWSGITFEFHTLVSGDWIVTQDTSDANGIVCGLVECGSPFKIVSLNPDFTIGNHKLPSDFVYEDDIDTDEVVGIATSSEEITDDRGPVHKYETQTCEQINKFLAIHYYFVFRNREFPTRTKF